MVRPNKHALAHAVDSWHLCQKQYQFFLRLYVFLFSFLFFFFDSPPPLTLIARLEQWAQLLSKVILSTTGKTIPRYDISATIHPFHFHRDLSVATLRLSSLSLCSPGERTVSSGSDAFRAFSFCLPFFRLPRDSSLYLLTVVVVSSSVSLFDSLLPSVDDDDDDEEGGWPRFQRNTNLSNYYVEKDHPVCSRLLCARQRFPLLSSNRPPSPSRRKRAATSKFPQG